MTQPLLSPTFLFRFSVPFLYHDPLWDDEGVRLAEEHRLPSFGELEDRPVFADLRGAWSEKGLAFSVEVSGKKQLLWCREMRLDDSDGLHIWIDTRDTHTVHRATHFCHRFVFLPTGDGRLRDEPLSDQMLIHRARENAKPIRPGTLGVRSQIGARGYQLQAYIPTDALTGFDPAYHPRLGFTYAVVDRELGWQTFSVSSEFRFTEDPSLWGSLDLIK